MGVIYIRTFRATSRKKRNRNIALIAVLGIAVVIFMLKMDTITQFLRTGQWVEESDSKSFIDALMGELSFVMHSGQYVIMHSSQIPLQIGNDIGYGLFAGVPTSLTPASLERLWTINTELLGSLRHGEIPCDMITQGYYDLKVFGVFLIPFVFGRLIKKVDERSFNTLLGNIVFAALFSVMIRAIPYGMVYDFVLGLFGLAVYYVVYKVIKLIPAKK